MKQSDEELMTDHEYDGIRELDNQLPLWWLAIFGATIIFAFIYLLHYESGNGLTQKEELRFALANLEAQRGDSSMMSEDELVSLRSQETESRGLDIYEGKCAACHGPTGGGLIGPNLTDKFWIHGNGSLKDLYATIAKGVPEKGMPAWADLMSKEDLIAVSSYVAKIKNQNVAGGKPPQGNETP